MVLASSAAAAAPAYELPKPLAFCSIKANAEACACETPPAKAPVTASERTVFLITVHDMRISSFSSKRCVIGRAESFFDWATTITQHHGLANGQGLRPVCDAPGWSRLTGCLRRVSPARTCACR